MKYIMVVDDSDVIREVVKRTLTIKNYSNIIEARNGVDALNIIKEKINQICLFIFDVNMPEMDGLQLLEEVRKINKTIPIIMLTTETDKDKIKKAKELGATGWIIKPFDGDKFIKVIDMYLKN